MNTIITINGTEYMAVPVKDYVKGYSRASFRKVWEVLKPKGWQYISAAKNKHFGNGEEATFRIVLATLAAKYPEDFKALSSDKKMSLGAKPAPQPKAKPAPQFGHAPYSADSAHSEEPDYKKLYEGKVAEARLLRGKVAKRDEEIRQLKSISR